MVVAGNPALPRHRRVRRRRVGRVWHRPVVWRRRPGWAARPLRWRDAALQEPLSEAALRLRARHEPLGLPRRCLRSPHDGRLSAVPARHGRRRTPGRQSGHPARAGVGRVEGDAVTSTAEPTPVAAASTVPVTGAGATTASVPDGVVIRTPRRLLRLEGAVLSIGALVAYSTTDRAWWLVPLTLLVPDLTMIGYLGGSRLGAYLYNLGHTIPLPAAVVAIGWWQDKSLIGALGLVWLAHIGLDRLLGYGLKYGDHFQHTHLGGLGGMMTARDARRG